MAEEVKKSAEEEAAELRVERLKKMKQNPSQASSNLLFAMANAEKMRNQALRQKVEAQNKYKILMLGSFHDNSITRMAKNSFSAFDIQPEMASGVHGRHLVRNTFIEKKPDKHVKFNKAEKK